jgi:hypothetical protein
VDLLDILGTDAPQEFQHGIGLRLVQFDVILLRICGRSQAMWEP